MERIVKNGAVHVGIDKYQHPLLKSINGHLVSVFFTGPLCEMLEVFLDDDFYCSAPITEKPASSPLRSIEKGSLERMVLRRKRQLGVFPVTSDNPPVPQDCRCRTVVRSEESLWREMLKAARRYRQLHHSSESEQFDKLMGILAKMHDEQLAKLNALNQSIKDLRGNHGKTNH